MRNKRSCSPIILGAELARLVKTITPPTKLKRTTFGTAGRYPIIDQSQVDIAGWTDEESSLVYPEKPLVIFGDHTCAVKLARTAFAQDWADGIKILQTVDSLDPLFLYYVLRVHPLDSSGYQRHFARLNLESRSTITSAGSPARDCRNRLRPTKRSLTGRGPWWTTTGLTSTLPPGTRGQR